MKIIGCNSWIRRIVKDERGASLVEFTLVAPLLFALAAGLAEFGHLLHQHHVVTKSVRDAARFAARSSADNWTTCASAPANWAAIQSNTQTVALRGSLDATKPLLLSNWNNASMVTVTYVCAPRNGLDSTVFNSDFPIITVTASNVPFNNGIGLLGFLGFTTISFSASHSQMWVGS